MKHETMWCTLGVHVNCSTANERKEKRSMLQSTHSTNAAFDWDFPDFFWQFNFFFLPIIIYALCHALFSPSLNITRNFSLSNRASGFYYFFHRLHISMHAMVGATIEFITQFLWDFEWFSCAMFDHCGHANIAWHLNDSAHRHSLNSEGMFNHNSMGIVEWPRSFLCYSHSNRRVFRFSLFISLFDGFSFHIFPIFFSSLFGFRIIGYRKTIQAWQAVQMVHCKCSPHKFTYFSLWHLSKVAWTR